MKEIRAYKLSNGTIIENEAEAIALEHRIEAIKDLTKLLNKEDYGMNTGMIVEFITENATELKTIINRM
jgi:hypothetical protein